MNGRAPQPMPYQGSKRQIASRILSYFPKEPVSRLVEPFAGSAALSIAVAMRRKATKFWLNDAHRPLVQLWKEILERPCELSTAYEKLWKDQQGREREYFDEIRRRFNRHHRPADFLYLLARCVKAAIRYNAYGEFNNTPDNRRVGARPSEMRARILAASELLSERTKLTALDYKETLSCCRTSDMVYMDPPYQGVCGQRDQRYAPSVNHVEFCRELAELNKQNIMFIVSYDGRSGEKRYGENLPTTLNLIHLEIDAGRSSQATLLGRTDKTYESLYLSPALAKKINYNENRPKRQQSFV